MDDHRLGFLAPSSIIIGILTLLITGGLLFTHGGTLFSPGPLNPQKGQPIAGVASHADLKGNCAACHGGLLQKTNMDERCSACHIDIQAQKGDPATLHGNLEKKNGNLECRSCHQEHGGSLTDLSRAKVDHTDFGYDLSAHVSKLDGSAFNCKDCHKQDFVTFDSGVCMECHLQDQPDQMQAHTQAFGYNCLACHDGIDTYNSNFNHDAFAFGLSGKHAEVACIQCHQNTHSPADLRSAPTDCNSCHTRDNPHSDLLGTDCASCHTTNDWQTATFDHNLAAYKLSGKHAEVACTDCHVNHDYTGLPTDCYSCHKGDDTHKGQYGTDCASCHTEAGWEQVQPFDHNAFSFKLTGQHVNVPCTSCHVNNVFKGTPTDCESCHRDQHGGGLYSHCAYCHTPDYW